MGRGPAQAEVAGLGFPGMRAQAGRWTGLGSALSGFVTSHYLGTSAGRRWYAFIAVSGEGDLSQ